MKLRLALFAALQCSALAAPQLQPHRSASVNSLGGRSAGHATSADRRPADHAKPFQPGKLGAVTAVKAAATGGAVSITCGADEVLVEFHSSTVARIWMATQGAAGHQDNFTDPAGAAGSASRGRDCH
jgi:hypothetical protein